MTNHPPIPTYQRIPARYIPDTPCTCPFQCVYRKDGQCDEPRINRGNSDAHCHRMGARALLKALSLVD